MSRANLNIPLHQNRRELDDAVLVLEARGAPLMSSGPGRSSGGANTNGAAAGLYERLVKAVLGRDKEASARQPGAQETLERLLRVLQGQAQNLKVGCTNHTASLLFLRALSLTIGLLSVVKAGSLHRNGANVQSPCDRANPSIPVLSRIQTLRLGINLADFSSQNVFHGELFHPHVRGKHVRTSPGDQTHLLDKSHTWPLWCPVVLKFWPSP